MAKGLWLPAADSEMENSLELTLSNLLKLQMGTLRPRKGRGLPSITKRGETKLGPERTSAAAGSSVCPITRPASHSCLLDPTRGCFLNFKLREDGTLPHSDREL